MYELKKNGTVFTSKFVGTGPLSYKKRIYRAAVSQRLRNTALENHVFMISQPCQYGEARGYITAHTSLVGGRWLVFSLCHCPDTVRSKPSCLSDGYRERLWARR